MVAKGEHVKIIDTSYNYRRNYSTDSFFGKYGLCSSP